MASTNQSPQYQKAEAKFLAAQNDKERVYWLDEMIKLCPKHKSAEKMLANLKTRRKKLLDKMENVRKSRKSRGKPGIKKEDMQAVIVGFSNSGKSSLLSGLTNTNPLISQQRFATKKPLFGMMPYSGTSAQIVEIPPVESDYFDRGLMNGADTVLVLFNDLKHLKDLDERTKDIHGKRLFIFNDFSMLSSGEKRKVSAFLQSKKYNFAIVSTRTNEGIDDLRERIFNSFDKIRIFTKEPGKPRSERPLILGKGSIVGDAAEKILHGFSQRVKEAKIWGPSSKFPGQVVGLKHGLKDMDTVEFKTR